MFYSHSGIFNLQTFTVGLHFNMGSHVKIHIFDVYEIIIYHSPTFLPGIVEDMKRRDIEFYTVGIGESPNLGELSDIATDPDSEHDFRYKPIQFLL